VVTVGTTTVYIKYFALSLSPSPPLSCIHVFGMLARINEFPLHPLPEAAVCFVSESQCASVRYWL
jgi:hypothetical protein